MRTPTLGKEMAFDNEWGPKIRSFLCKTRIGYGPDLNWDDETDVICRNDSEIHDSGGFEAGTFE
jgi:hypothetical protein